MNHVSVVVDGTLATITLRRPERANALDLDTARELLEAVRAATAAECNVEAILIVAAGPHFCAGGDVHAMATADSAWAGQVAGLVHEAIYLLHSTRRVVVVGARGAVAGAGLSLSLVADLVVAAPTTRFLAAWGKIGLTPDGGATWLLPRIVGVRRASSMILGGREVSGVDSVSWGLATEMAAEREVEHRARELALATVSVSGRSAGTARHLLQSSWDTDLRLRLDEELIAVVAARNTNQPAVDRFISQQRQPPTSTHSRRRR